MSRQKTIHSLGDALRQNLLTWAMPRLIELPPNEWERAALLARNVEFDAVERIAIVAGVGFTAYALRFDPEQAASLSVLARYLIQFLISMPVLLLVVGPFMLRRARRGLDQVIAARRQTFIKESSHESNVRKP